MPPAGLPFLFSLLLVFWWFLFFFLSFRLPSRTMIPSVGHVQQGGLEAPRPGERDRAKPLRPTLRGPHPAGGHPPHKGCPEPTGGHGSSQSSPPETLVQARQGRYTRQGFSFSSSYFIFLFFLFLSKTLSVAVSPKQGCQRELGGPFQGTGFRSSEAGGKGFKSKRQELAAGGLFSSQRAGGGGTKIVGLGKPEGQEGWHGELPSPWEVGREVRAQGEVRAWGGYVWREEDTCGAREDIRAGAGVPGDPEEGREGAACPGV